MKCKPRYLTMNGTPRGRHFDLRVFVRPLGVLLSITIDQVLHRSPETAAKAGCHATDVVFTPGPGMQLLDCFVEASGPMR